jgi:hypothetical protein
LAAAEALRARAGGAIDVALILRSRPSSRTAKDEPTPNFLRHGLLEHKRENARENEDSATSVTGRPRVEVRGWQPGNGSNVVVLGGLVAETEGKKPARTRAALVRAETLRALTTLLPKRGGPIGFRPGK